MEPNVWVVWGANGQYSDRWEWIVGAFSSEALANEWLTLAQAAQVKLERSRWGSFDPTPTPMELAAFRAEIGDQKAHESTEFEVEGVTIDALAVYLSHGTPVDESGQR